MPKIVKFFFIGVINTAFYYFLYAFLIFSGFHYSIAVVIAALIAMIFSFKTFGKFVFKNSNNKLILRFALVTLLNYLLNIGVISLFYKFGLNYYWAGFIAALFVAVNSFILNNYFVFNKKIKTL